MRHTKLFILSTAIFTIFAASACRHTAGPGVHHGNHLLFNPEGLLHFGHLKGPLQCDRKMGDGKVKLTFPSKDAAKAYAEKCGIPARVHQTPPKRLKLQAYADNFK